jgi:hypothetical protein
MQKLLDLIEEFNTRVALALNFLFGISIYILFACIITGSVVYILRYPRTDSSEVNILTAFGYQTKMIEDTCFTKVDEKWMKCRAVINSPKGFKNLNQD